MTSAWTCISGSRLGRAALMIKFTVVHCQGMCPRLMLRQIQGDQVDLRLDLQLRRTEPGYGIVDQTMKEGVSIHLVVMRSGFH